MDPDIQAAIDDGIAAAVAQMQAAAAIAAAAAAAVPAPVPVVIPDIKSPGQIQGPLDLTKPDIMKIHKASIVPLSTIFDGKPESLRMFLIGVQRRGKDFGWETTIFDVPDVQGVNHPFIQNYGRFTDVELRAFVATYMGVRPITRMEQASHQLYAMLSDSISDILKTRVAARMNDYTYDGEMDGLLMLKVILSLVQVDTKATVSVITEQFFALESKLQELDYNIQDFNIHVETLVQALTCRDEQVPNLIPILFKVYKKVPDDIFCEFMRSVESRWETNDPAIITHDNVAVLALKKWQGLVQKGEWKAETKKDEFILALQAENEKLRSESSAKKDKGSKASSESPKSNVHTGKWAWKAVAPKPGEPTKKKFNSKEYMYCPNHGDTKWVLVSGHADGCKLAKATAGGDTSNEGPASTAAPKAPTREQLVYAKALASVMSQADDGEVE